MSVLVRQIMRVAAVAAGVGAAAVVLTAPAVAAPTQQAQPPDCSAPQDGVSVCINTEPNATNPDHVDVWGTIVTTDGSSVRTGMVALETYTSERSMAQAVGRDAAEITTEHIGWGRGASYFAVASWVDAAGHVHSGIRNTD